jgi:hypothetical protein
MCDRSTVTCENVNGVECVTAVHQWIRVVCKNVNGVECVTTVLLPVRMFMV